MDINVNFRFKKKREIHCDIVNVQNVYSSLWIVSLYFVVIKKNIVMQLSLLYVKV